MLHTTRYGRANLLSAVVLTLAIAANAILGFVFQGASKTVAPPAVAAVSVSASPLNAQPLAAAADTPRIVDVKSTDLVLAAHVTEAPAKAVKTALVQAKPKPKPKAKARHSHNAKPKKPKTVKHATKSTKPAAAPVSPGGGSQPEVVKQALSKVGSKYEWGASGPDTFDCSGLMQWSYKQVGKSLPRTANAMSHTGKHVDVGDLQPGDLVFYYSPVSHVGMYIGDGKIVHASTSSKPVLVADLRPNAVTESRRV